MRREMWISATTWNLIDKVRIQKEDQVEERPLQVFLMRTIEPPTEQLRKVVSSIKRTGQKVNLKKLNKLHLEMTPEHYLELHEI